MPQAFGWKNGINWVMPTCEQLRCEAYFYLVYGVTGLCWYAFASPEEDKNTPYNAYCVYDYPDRWDYLTYSNHKSQITNHKSQHVVLRTTKGGCLLSSF